MTTVEGITIPEDFKEDISRAVRILKDAGCSEIFLFGSGTKGKFRERSDLDLAITGCPHGSFFQLLGKLLLELKHPVDLVKLDTKDDFALYLKKEGDLIRIG
jgi:predicted nucleotidyltransferase